ncbi:MAG: GIY-YIG nuclease family protein [Kiloniellaceae bacterium]
MAYYVYILASAPNGTLYIGVTNDLVRRVYEHREGLADGFTNRHGVKTLVYYEAHERVEQAIQREKNMKHWSRAWKVELIQRDNPHWSDLWDSIASG